MLHLLDVEVRHAYPAHLAFSLELRHGRPSLFEFRGVVHRPMDLVEINSFHAQAAQAVFTLAANGVCLEHFANLAAAIATESTLGEDVGPSTRPLGECTGNDLFGVAEAIYGGRIDP